VIITGRRQDAIDNALTESAKMLSASKAMSATSSISTAL
jgi:hypothetical protein